MNIYSFPFSSSVSLLLSILLLWSYLIKIHVANEIDKGAKDDVLSLTAQDFNSFVNNEKRYALLIIYAPWCHWSNMLLSHMGTLKVLLGNDEQVNIAKINGIVNAELVERLNVYSYPAVLMIKGDNVHRFLGGRTIRNIIMWVYEIMNDMNVYEMKTIDKLEKYIERSENTDSIIFFVNKNDENEALMKSLKDMCVDIKETYCFHIKEKQVIDYLEDVIMPRKRFSINADQKNKNIYTIIYKNNEFDEHFIMQEEKVDDIYDLSIPYEERLQILKTFIVENRTPLVIKFSEMYYDILFSPDIVTLFIIYNNMKDLNKIDIINSARKYKTKLVFSISGTQEVFEKRLLSELIIDQVDKPVMRIIEFKENMDIPLKYKPLNDDVEINEKNIDEFVEGYFSERRYFYRKSERPLPDEINNGYVKIVVADNYEDHIFKNDKHVLMLYYAPWCGHCRKFEPIYRELGKRISMYGVKYKDYKNDIIVSKIDAANNEVYNISIEGYPTLYLYEKSNKNNPIKYTGMRTVKGIVSWISEIVIKNKKTT